MLEQKIQIQLADGSIGDAVLKVDIERDVELSIEMADGQEFDASGLDIPLALSSLRQQMEPVGYRLLINGSRKDVVWSGMARSMGLGRKAYAVHMGQSTSRDDLLDVLAPATATQVATLDSQEDFKKQWLRSLDER